MRLVLAAATVLCLTPPAVAHGADYAALWEKSTPFATFLEEVRARKDQWRTRFADAAIEAEALTRARALPGKRRILVVAEDRCSDSAWAVPYLAKLAAAVPDKLELRVIRPAQGGSSIQSDHLTPDGRLATPTVVVLDEQSRLIGAWVERPGELQKWYLDKGTAMPTEERYAHVSRWYTDDGGRTTVREVMAILEGHADERK